MSSSGLINIPKRIENNTFSIRFKPSIFYLAVLIGFFFEPTILSYMQRDGIHAGLARMVSYAYSGMKILISIYAVLSVGLKKIRVKNSTKLLVWFILYSLSILLSCIINSSLSISQIAVVFQQIGLILFLYYNIKKNPKETQESGILFFGFMSLCCCANMLLKPNGLYYSSAYYSSNTVYSSIFIFGGKNASFPYYFCFLLSWIAYCLKWNIKKTRAIPIIGIFIFSAIRCRSVNTLVCLIIVLIIYVLISRFPGFATRINPNVIFTILAASIVLIYMGAGISLFSNALTLLGRNSTFSGRVAIWMEAIQVLSKHPLFGNGSFAFNTLYGTVNHAHSQYMDRLAKYGIFSFALFIYCLLLYFKVLKTEKNRVLQCFLTTMSAVYMLHMAFDTYHINYLIYIFMIAISFIGIEDNSENQNTEIQI